jgi:hypothetical protein
MMRAKSENGWQENRAVRGAGWDSVLEVHCANLHASHILVSHLGVAMLCALASLVIGWVIDARTMAASVRSKI